MATIEIPTPYRLRVKQRLAVVSYAEEYDVKPAGRHIGSNPKTIRVWRDRWRDDAAQGLLPRYPARRKRHRLGDRVIGLIKRSNRTPVRRGSWSDLARARASGARHSPDDSTRIS
jgi:transposase-like protein